MVPNVTAALASCWPLPNAEESQCQPSPSVKNTSMLPRFRGCTSSRWDESASFMDRRLTPEAFPHGNRAPTRLDRRLDLPLCARTSDVNRVLNSD